MARKNKKNKNIQYDTAQHKFKLKILKMLNVISHIKLKILKMLNVI
jgi:hypothetical protein